MQIKLIFTLSLILKVRVFGTPKWSVVLLRNELLIQQISINNNNNNISFICMTIIM